MDIEIDNKLEHFLSEKENEVEQPNQESIQPIQPIQPLPSLTTDNYNLSNELNVICNSGNSSESPELPSNHKVEVFGSVDSFGSFEHNGYNFSDDFIGHNDMEFDKTLSSENSDAALNMDGIGLNDTTTIKVDSEKTDNFVAGTVSLIDSVDNISVSDDDRIDTGIDIKESKAKKQRLLNIKTVDEIAYKFSLNEKDTDNLKKLNTSDAINVDFFLKLREILKCVPVKSKIMDEFNIRKSYTGFHDWFDGERIDLPNVGMNSIAQNLGYSLMIVPIKNDKIESKYKVAIDNLQMDFLEEIDERIQCIVKEEASKIKPKKLDKKQKSPAMVNSLDPKDNSDIALGFTDELPTVDDDTINENAKYIDTNEDIVERTTVLDDKISFEFDPNNIVEVIDKTSMENYEFNPTMENMTPQQVEDDCSFKPVTTTFNDVTNSMMDDDYDDSLEHTIIVEPKKISESPISHTK